MEKTYVRKKKESKRDKEMCTYMYKKCEIWMNFEVDKVEEKKPNTTLQKKYEKLNLKNI